jgi:hypothetical protein
MHIKTLCPRCESTYQVDPGLKGKRMRCPNTLCRAIFEVRDVAEAAAPAIAPPPAPVTPPTPARSGSVGDLVPILSAEVAVPEMPAPQPRRQPPAPPPPEPVPVEAAAPTAEEQRALDAFFAGAAPLETTVAENATEPTFFAPDSAPPVRQQGMEGPPSTDGVLLPLPVLPESLPQAASGRHWRRMAVLLLLLSATIAVAAWLLLGTGAGDEAGRFARAEKEYKDRNFADAAAGFTGLFQDFPESENRPKYQFYAALSRLRDQVHRVHASWEETQACIEEFGRFLEVFQSDPLFEKHKDDLAESLYKLVEETTYYAGLNDNRAILDVAKRLNDDAGKRFGPAPELQASAIRKAVDEAEEKIQKVESRNKLLAELRERVANPSADALLQARQLVASVGAGGDSEVKELLQKIQTAHRESINFNDNWAGEALREITEDTPPSLLVLPFEGSIPPAASGPKGRAVFAVVRGVLYAFDPVSGLLRWARRIGVDSQSLPVWLPPTPAAPPAVMIASSDQGGLLALDGLSGAVLWFLPLPDICPGQPVIVGQRAYVACRPGAVFEIDTAGGRCLGAYVIDQTLAWQGVRQPGTDLVYFAANRLCVYALDVARRQCATVLYSNHAPGALLCGPIIVPLLPSGTVDPGKPAPPRGQLLLSVARGPAATDVLMYALPLTDPDQQPVPLDSLPGRMWFPPGQNGEMLALLSDAGALSLFGIRQPNNLDPDLFPLFRTDLVSGGPGSSRFGAQVVYVGSGEVWVLSQRKLFRCRASFDSKTGWGVQIQDTGWKLGTPLHDSQVQANQLGGDTLFVVTEGADGASFWMSAIDTLHAESQWQRQLGWMCKGQPVAAGNYVLGRDAKGVLLQFDAGRLTPLPDSDWRVSSRAVTDVLKVTDEAGWVLPAPDGKTMQVMAVHGLEVRVTPWHDGSFGQTARFTLESPVAGTPALLGDAVVLPLANGRLCQLQPGGKATVGKEWRAKEADARAVGHVVAVGSAMFACTDGGGGITLWRIVGEDWQKLASVKVGGRILAPPAVVPLAGKPGEWGICVADTERKVTLLHADGLRKLQQWVLSDNITAGPFARGHGIGLILGGRRLVWLDPSKNEPHYAHTFRADLVGLPEMVDGLLIVADMEGRFQAVDPWAKRFVGLGYTLRANIAPAAAPVPFGDDRLLVPLTDGTALLLSRQWFRPHILGFSTVR